MNLKKIVALIMAAVMVLALSASALAEPTATPDPIGSTGVIDDTTNKVISIKKQLTAYNPAGKTVNAPSITYTYAIAGLNAAKAIKDSDGVGTTTVKGPDGATITSSISWDAEKTADQLTTAVGGEANTKNIEISFANVTFPAAGVYRYVITEMANYTNTGVVDGNDHTRYLDVYVKNSATADQYEIYGYVLFTNNNNIDGTTGAEEADKPAKAAKTEGFVGDKADKYYTYNVTIKKALSGDSGMNGHQFPFAVTFTGSEANVLPIITKENTATIPAWNTKGAMSTFNTTVDGATLKIANGGSVTVAGIPVGTSIAIVEKNDVTGTTYTVSTSGADTNITAGYVASSASSGSAAINEQTAGSAADKTVVFTNELELISPTGYVARIAPYAIMLAAGVALLVFVFAKRRKTEEKD